jgi:N-acetylglucosamine-6-phosphate deacetylase
VSSAGSIDAPDLLLAGGRVVMSDAVLDDAWVHVAGGAIVEVAERRPAADLPVVDLGGAWLLPGYIDLHVHGGGGHSVASSQEAMDAAVAYHRTRGTTATLVSLVTAPVEELVVQAGWAASLTRRGPTPRGCVLGSHLEGPFLSPRRRGAHELDGALDLIPRLKEQGIIAAIGHSDASYEQAKAAIQAGVDHATHLFNGMGPLHHRAPGLVGAALEAGIACELINDGRHLHPAVITLVCRLIDCPILITDAIDAAGVGDGTFDLGGLAVHVQDGEARLATTRSLAGSTLTMDEALRRAVRDSGLPIEEAAAAAATNPARVLGLEDRLGSIAPGRRADLVVLDDEFAVCRVMAAGAWVSEEVDDHAELV